VSEILLIVCDENLHLKTIRLVPPIEAREGKGLNIISCEDGTEYFFTKEGFYDGWGRPMKGIEDGKLEIFDPQGMDKQRRD